MNCFLLLLLCIKTLCGCAELSSNTQLVTQDKITTSEMSHESKAANVTSNQSSSIITTFSTPDVTSLSPGSKPISTITKSTTTASTTTASEGVEVFFKKECLLVSMVSGGLILACTILLFSTLLLIWKVCQLSRRLKALSSNADLISNTKYCVGTAEKNENKSEPEAKETSILMADFSETQEDMGNGTAKEEGGTVNEEGQMGEENKKEVEGTAGSEETSTGDNKVETPVTVAENSSSSQPQEDTANSQFTNAEAASSSGGTEESKDVV